MSVSRAYTFGEVLKQFRVRAGLSQQYLAEALHFHRNTISNWECGNDLPKTRPVVLTLAETLNLDEEETDALLNASFHERLYETLWNVPHERNPYFTGREVLLTHLHQQLSNASVVALTQAQAVCGLGGIGKTQTVIEYTYRYRDAYRAVLWVKADSRENLLANFVALASLLKLPERDAPDQMVTINAVKRWLQEETGWLLIVDNADDLSIVKEFLAPGCRGHILLTTRAQAMGGLVQRVEIETMPPEEGTLFLLRRAGLIGAQTLFAGIPAAYREVGLEIVHDLGGLPLALDQAGAYMEESSCHPADYLRLYRQQRTALLARRGGLTTDHPEPVTTTWALSFQQVEQMNPLAADLLRLCAFLDPDTIPEEVLAEGTEDAPLDPLRMNEALAILLRFSLIRRNIETRTLTMHRLVQAVIHDAMDKEMQRAWAIRTAQSVKRAFPQASNVYSALGYPYRAVQLLKASIHVDQEHGNKQNLVTALWNLAVQQQVLGKLSSSEQSLQECIALCHDIHDGFNEAKAYQYLALLRAYQGQFLEASRNLDLALSLFKQADSVVSESAVWAYRALCALLAKDTREGLKAANCAYKIAKMNQAERDIIRANWLLGWGYICLATEDSEHTAGNLQQAEQHLQDALDHCQRIQMVDYEADLLLAWARLHFAKGDSRKAKQCAEEALVITNRADFRVLRADVHNFLAHVALADGSFQEAMSHAQAAFQDALCDVSPFCYKLALDEAKRLLAEIEVFQ